MNKKENAEKREQFVLILTLVGVGIAVIGLGYQMALPDPNSYVGCLVMLAGVAFVIVAIWQTSSSRRAKVAVSGILSIVICIIVYLTVTARANFNLRITSAVFTDRPPSDVRVQLWADIENVGNKIGLIRSWELSAKLPDGTLLNGIELYGQRTVGGPDGRDLPSDSLDDKTENTLILPSAHPKGFLFFLFYGTTRKTIEQYSVIFTLMATDEHEHKFCVRETNSDIINGIRGRLEQCHL